MIETLWGLTSPWCRLVIPGGHPDLLDPVLGQLSGHSSGTVGDQSRFRSRRGTITKTRKKGAGVCV